MTAKPTPAEPEAGLAQFYGTTHYYSYMGVPGHARTPLVLTDGTQFLGEKAGCYWLYDIVFSVLPKLRGEGFAQVKLSVNLAKHKGVVVIDDGNDRKLYRQVIPYTDFPLAEITLFLENGEVGGKPSKVLLLPSEH